MKQKTVLVSGGAGYIGSHTAVELINAGLNVVVADNLSNSDMSGVEGVRKITGVDVPFIDVDCCDKEAFRKVFEQYEFDSVIHFAAFKAVGESVADPMKYYRNNLLSFMNVIELMREFDRHNIVFSSSATVYGEADELPVTESRVSYSRHRVRSMASPTSSPSPSSRRASRPPRRMATRSRCARISCATRWRRMAT